MGKLELEAYLDIETTGLSCWHNEITVIGIYTTDGLEEQFCQLVGEKINSDAIYQALSGTTSLYTYNGHRFDLPFISARYGLNLESEFEHCDLMHHCWRNNLYGGLKTVERCLGIERRLKEVNGYEAVRLWWRYINNYDMEALQILLDYNREDVVNLKTIKDRLIPPDPNHVKLK